MHIRALRSNNVLTMEESAGKLMFFIDQFIINSADWLVVDGLDETLCEKWYEDRLGKVEPIGDLTLVDTYSKKFYWATQMFELLKTPIRQSLPSGDGVWRMREFILLGTHQVRLIEDGQGNIPSEVWMPLGMSLGVVKTASGKYRVQYKYPKNKGAGDVH